jgi:hypothetical protein
MSEEYCTPGEAYELLNDFMEWIGVAHVGARKRCAEGSGNVSYHAGYTQALQDAVNWWQV